MAKILITYYSRTKITKKVAEYIKTKLKCDIEEIIDTKKRGGPIGYVASGKDAALKKLTKLKPIKSKLKNYDLIIVGGPVWSWNLSSPIRTYLRENKENFNKLAFFCTEGGSGEKTAFKEMEKESNKKPIATLTVLTKEVASNNFAKKVDKFIKKL
jgi:flavodoxin